MRDRLSYVIAAQDALAPMQVGPRATNPVRQAKKQRRPQTKKTTQR